MDGAPAQRRVALRTVNPALVDQVRRLTDLVGADLEVLAAGAPPPRAVLLLDDGVGDGAWRQQPGGPPVLRVHDGDRVPRGVLGEARVTAAHGARDPGGGTGADAAVEPVSELRLPEDAEALLELVASGPPRARTIAVVGAHGGAGASVLAAALARAAVTAGAATCLVDLDPAGGGIDVLLGIEHDPGLRWADLDENERVYLPHLAMSLPVWCGVRVLSGDLRGGVAADGSLPAAAVDALAQTHDVLVLDMPRQLLAPGAAGGELLSRCAHGLVVAGSDVRAAAAAVAAGRSLTSRGVPAQLVVHRRGGSTGDAEEVAEAAGLALAGLLRGERSLRAALERGLAPGDQPRGPLLPFARRLVHRLELAR